MPWNSVIGQDRSKQMLQQILSEGRIAHAYLFYGSDGVGKDALALEFARTFLCETGSTEACGQCHSCHRADGFNHPNLQFLFAVPSKIAGFNAEESENEVGEKLFRQVREQQEIKRLNPYRKIFIPPPVAIGVGAVRDLKKNAGMASFERRKKIFIISRADMMTQQAQNALLKTLEEPPEETLLILTTSHRDRLLPTIISRCQSMHCDQLSRDEIEHALITREKLDSGKARLAARLSDGNYSAALDIAETDLLELRNDVVEFLLSIVTNNAVKMFAISDERFPAGKKGNPELFLSQLTAWLRDAMLTREKFPDAIVNQDMEERLVRFADRFGRDSLPEAIKCVQATVELLPRNVYLPLLLPSLFIELQSLFLHE